MAALLLAGCAQPAPPACTAPLRPAVAYDLYFGRDRAGGGEVTESDWAAFLAEVVTPRFPDGLSVLDVQGQHRPQAGGPIVRERSKLLVLVVFDAATGRARLDEIVAAYRQRFRQEAVFRVEQAVCAGT